MDKALLFLGLLWALFTKKERRTGYPPYVPAPSPPYVPYQPPTGALETSTPPWPAAVPTDLPAFPGTGWEYDEPPPAAVQQRAGQLVSQLWKTGKGASKIEQTAGRWIAYQAGLTKGNKQGVIAYRLKSARATPALPRPAAPAAAAPRTVLTSTSPGVPQAGGPLVPLVAGKWYQFSARVALPAGLTAADVARAIGAAGGRDVLVTLGPPVMALYVQQAPATYSLELNRPVQLFGVTVTFLSALEARPIAATPASSPAATPAATAMPDLKFGMGLKPAAPVPEVLIVQQRLGVTPADGRFGAGTRTAVINFQKKTGLAPNLPNAELEKRGFGAVKQATWVKLFDSQVRA